MGKCRFDDKVSCFSLFKDCPSCPRFHNASLDDIIGHETRIQITIAGNEYAMCPFCLYRTFFKDFATRKKLLECPECKERFRTQSLILVSDNMSAEKYAEWVFGYGKYFWKKIDFKKFNDRLWKYGISREFWDSYHMMKSRDYRMM